MEWDDSLQITIKPPSRNEIGTIWTRPIDHGHQICGMPSEDGMPTIYLAKRTYQQIYHHSLAARDGRECGGVLLGGVGKDQEGSYLVITDSIRALQAVEKAASITFTHETWDKCNRMVEKRQDGSKIVGWYHTHPGYGVFFSAQDTFIQQHFFAGEQYIGLVLDPKVTLLGTFQWLDHLVQRKGFIVFISEQEKQLGKFIDQNI